MGVRLVRHGLEKIGGSGTYDHDELENRDLPDQHPISAITGLQKELNKKLEVINFTARGSDNLYLNYNVSSKLLQGYVRIMSDKNNDIKNLEEGLFVPKYIGVDTTSIKCSMISKGESLQEIYDNGFKFEHQQSTWSDRAPSVDAIGYDAWYWDDYLQSFVMPNNPKNLTGFITERKYDGYTHEVTVKSGFHDDDFNGVIIAAMRDNNGYLHTLTCGVDHGGWPNFRWGICYNYRHPNQHFVYRRGDGDADTKLTKDQMPQNRPSGGWNGDSVRIKVTKNKNIITCECSDWNSSSYNSNTKLTLNLNNYSWGYRFTGRVHYGYCSESQPDSYFQNPKFYSEDCAAPYTVECSLRISASSGNIARINSDGLYVPPPKNFISGTSSNLLKYNSSGYLYVDHNSIQRSVFTITSTAVSFSIGDFVYYDRDAGRYDKALAVEGMKSNVIGMVCNGSGNTYYIMTHGYLSTGTYSSFLSGYPFYLSDTDAGKAVQSSPAVSRLLGYRLSDGILISMGSGSNSGGGSGGGGAGSTVIDVVQADHGLSVGDVVYLNSSNKYVKAIANGSTEIKVIGIVSKVVDTSTFSITTHGEIKGSTFPSASIGSVLFLSESTYGLLVTSISKYRKPVAVKTNDGIYVLIQREDIKYTPYTETEIRNTIKALW